MAAGLAKRSRDDISAEASQKRARKQADDDAKELEREQQADARSRALDKLAALKDQRERMDRDDEDYLGTSILVVVGTVEACEPCGFGNVRSAGTDARVNTVAAGLQSVDILNSSARTPQLTHKSRKSRSHPTHNDGNDEADDGLDRMVGEEVEAPKRKVRLLQRFST